MLKRALLSLALALTMSGCIHRTHRHPSWLASSFPNVTTPLPQGADVWVCEFKTGFQVCDAVNLKGEGVFTRLISPEKRESLTGYLRINQRNGMTVYWRLRLMMTTKPPQQIGEGCYRQDSDNIYCPPREW